MKTASKPAVKGVDTVEMDRGVGIPPKGIQAEKSRVLFGASEWPGGMIELASWSKQKNLAEPSIFYLTPGRLFRIKDKQRKDLADGVVKTGIMLEFMEHGIFPSEASVLSKCGNAWTLRDEKDGRIYSIVDENGRLNVYDHENYDLNSVKSALTEFTSKKGLERSRFFNADDSLNQDVLDALSSVGGKFIKKLLDFNPNVVGFRLAEGGMEKLKKYILAVRLFSDAFVVVGGPTPISHPKEVLDDSVADFVFAGEAEETFNSFLRAVGSRNAKSQLTKEDHAKLLEIPGLTFRHGGRIYHNTLPADGYGRTILDMDVLMSPEERRRLTYMKRPYTSESLMRENKLDWSLLENFTEEFDFAALTSGRGCPGLCIFCSRLHGRVRREKTAEEILGEVREMDRKVLDGTIKIKRKKFYSALDDKELKDREVFLLGIFDEDFFLDRERALKFLQLWRRDENKDLRDRYRLQFQANPSSLLGGREKPDDLFEKIMVLVGEHKALLSLGVEAFNPEFLMRLKNRRHTPAQTDVVLDRLDRAGVDYVVGIIRSDYDTTPEEFIDSMKFLWINGVRRRNMRVFCSDYVIPYFDSFAGRNFDYLSSRDPKIAQSFRHFSDYERAHPELMDPLVVKMIDSSKGWMVMLQKYVHTPFQSRICLQEAFLNMEKTIEDELSQAEDESSRERLKQLKYQAEASRWGIIKATVEVEKQEKDS